jgi:hypothetical protein
VLGFHRTQMALPLVFCRFRGDGGLIFVLWSRMLSSDKPLTSSQESFTTGTPGSGTTNVSCNHLSRRSEDTLASTISRPLSTR